jgi:peptide/nickel transport system permease protein
VTAYILRRLLQMIPVVLGITLIVFVLVRISGDPVVLMLPEDAERGRSRRCARRSGSTGPSRCSTMFLRDLLRGDFGTSLRYTNQDGPADRPRAAARHAAAHPGGAGWSRWSISFPLGIIAAATATAGPTSPPRASRCSARRCPTSGSASC